MNDLVPEYLITETKVLLKAVRGSLIKVAQNLYLIRESLDKDTPWGLFLEDNFGMSEGFASKLLTVNRIYLIEGGVEPEKLEGVDMEKLYLARNLPGNTELKIEKARSLTRRSLKEEKNEEEPHEHELIQICKICSMRVS